MGKLEDAISAIEPIKKGLHQATQARLDNLTKPRGSLGRLEEFARRYVAITGRENPKIEKKAIYTFAADHGVAEEGVSTFPKEVTAQMVYNFLRGGAGINVLARLVGAEVRVVDIGVDHDFESQEGLIIKKVAKGTRNISKGPAMSREEATRALEIGIELAEEAVEQGMDLLGTGDMGIANTTPSSAMAAVLTGEKVEKVTGRGTGIDDKTLKRKIEVINRALEVNQPDPRDSLDVLAKVGGFEIGGIAGLILGAAANKIPVVVDGFISSAGALIAVKLQPLVKEYILAAHRSVEVGHRAVLDEIRQRAMLDLDLRLGEGTGAAL
ncbi:MAG: nicotinate-nucleotide--dimethylbenzimidazole phosphoribosyltransferase, partial [Deltaproteobacteria bacterium]